VPVSGAIISARSGASHLVPGTLVATAIADQNGHYALTTGLDDYVLEARFPGFTVAQTWLSSSESSADLQIFRAAELTGRVLRRSDGAPVVGATVRARSSELMTWNTVSTLTDRSGAFTLKGLRPETVELTADAQELTTYGETLVPLRAAQRSTAPRLWLDRAFSISGAVYRDDERSQPVAGMSVIATASESTRVWTADLSSNGEFTISELPPGQYAMQVHEASGALIGVGAQIEVVDANVIGQQLVVPRARMIAGHTTPPRSAELTLRSLTDSSFRTDIHSGPGGSFSFVGVPRGWFTLVGHADNGTIAEVSVDTRDRDETNLDVQFESPSTISGTVLDTTGGSIGHGWIEATSMDENTGVRTVRRIPIDARGAFEVRGLRPNTYAFWLSDDYGPRSWLASDDANTPQIRRIGAGTARLSFEAPACGAMMHGSVVDRQGSPLPRAWVTVRRNRANAALAQHSPDSVGRTVQTTLDASWELPRVCAGSYNVNAISETGQLVGSEQDVHPGNPLRLVLTDVVTLSGSVTFGGAPVTDYKVVLANAISLRQASMYSADGSYQLAGLSPDVYEVLIVAQRGYSCELVSLGSDLASTRNFELRAWGSLRGQILDARGTPTPNVDVEMIVEPPANQATDLLGPRFRISRTTTDAKGVFAFDRLPAGDGYITLSSAGHRTLISNTRYLTHVGWLEGPGTRLGVRISDVPVELGTIRTR
jgi:hypothetical protein